MVHETILYLSISHVVRNKVFIFVLSSCGFYWRDSNMCSFETFFFVELCVHFLCIWFGVVFSFVLHLILFIVFVFWLCLDLGLRDLLRLIAIQDLCHKKKIIINNNNNNKRIFLAIAWWSMDFCQNLHRPSLSCYFF